MTEQRWEYRAQSRHRQVRADEAVWSDWATIETRGNKAGRGAYKTVGAARGIISREKRANQKRWWLQGEYTFEWEYRVQRRPVSDGWETV